MQPTPVTRRRFVQRAALASAATAAAPYFVPSRLFGADAPSKQIAVGHIGVGGRGTGLMGGFLGQPECRVVAVSDCFGSRREQAAHNVDAHYKVTGCRKYADFRELCADPGIDAVVVATPDHWHVLAALEAVRNGKHVYVEKPLGISVEQDHTLREAVNRYGVQFQYGTQQRAQSHMRWVCEMVVNGRLGKLLAVEVDSPGGIQGGSTEPIPVPEDLDYDRFLGPAPEAPYTSDRCTSNGSYHISDFALGFIAGWGAHPLDIMVWGWATRRRQSRSSTTARESSRPEGCTIRRCAGMCGASSPTERSSASAAPARTRRRSSATRAGSPCPAAASANWTRPR